jgi:L-fuculose-phosphate aldolase
MARLSLVAGSVGNLSVRCGSRLLITPTSLPYESMRRRDLVLVDEDGRPRAGSRAPSRELPLHLAIYRSRPDVGAIVHCHSVWAAAWSYLGERLQPETEETTYYGIGQVRTAQPAAAGTEALARAAAESLGSSRAVLLSGHGTVAVAATCESAVTIAAAVEHQAQIAWLLRLGGTGSGSRPVE